MKALVVLAACLGVPGLLPALAVARRSPALIFLAPLCGATMAAVAAVLEVGVSGSLVTWYVAVAVLVNLAVVVWWRRAGRFRPWPSPPAGWTVLTVVVILGALVVPLAGLGGHVIGWDANSIWLTHALMLLGGHRRAVTDLLSSGYRFSNPDYPPLVPAAEALALAVFGRTDLQVAVEVTVGLNACGLGIAASGIAALAGSGRAVTRVCGIAVAGTVCIAGFALAGKTGIDGYADLTWAAAAVAAIIWGLVLPRSTQALLVAWVAAATASLTKNEGLTTALIVLVLVAVRYAPLRLGWPGPTRTLGVRQAGEAGKLVREWAWRGALVVLPALPGLGWAGLVRILGLHDAFFAHRGTESMPYRAGVAIAGLAHQLYIVPFALVVLAVGSMTLRPERERAGLGNPAWLWTAAVGSLAVIFATYVLGGLEIHQWLESSVGRTTIFTKVLMYSELAIWLVIAVDAAARLAGERPVPARLTPPEPDPALEQRERYGADYPGRERHDRTGGHNARAGAG
jgi:hypothetical protein